MENDPNSEEIDDVTHPNGNYDTGSMIFSSRFPITYNELLMCSLSFVIFHLRWKNTTCIDEKSPWFVLFANTVA